MLLLSFLPTVNTYIRPTGKGEMKVEKTQLHKFLTPTIPKECARGARETGKWMTKVKMYGMDSATLWATTTTVAMLRNTF